jgi:hypothetical protein
MLDPSVGWLRHLEKYRYHIGSAALHSSTDKRTDNIKTGPRLKAKHPKIQNLENPVLKFIAFYFLLIISEDFKRLMKTW